MSYVLRVVACPAIPQIETDVSGMFIEAIDVDGEYGAAMLTARRSHAMKFATPKDAYEAYATQSLTHPLRPDGKPNCPLKLFSIAIEPALVVLQ